MICRFVTASKRAKRGKEQSKDLLALPKSVKLRRQSICDWDSENNRTFLFGQIKVPAQKPDLGDS